ncbi:MAG: phage/plasmid primase, P4 family [Rhodopila sp.]|nr:phage/plasmid primase, P4 family [Rhodopila sp.]
MNAGSLVDSALALAARGIPTFPLRLNKRPCTDHGFKEASTDPDTVRRMFANPLAALIGVPTGAVSGMDVLDIDPARAGDEWLRDNKHRLPATRWHHTRSGGLHALLKHAPGMGNSSDRIAPGVDVRGDGGYIVWWPAQRFHTSGDVWGDWPDWLLIQALRNISPNTPVPNAEDLAPPDAVALLSLIADMPNPSEATRDDYTFVNLAVQGCVRSLEALGRLDDPASIYDAAAEWSARWDSASASSFEDERRRWDDDWSQRDRDISGWRHLIGLAGKLGADVSAFTLAEATAEFGALPPEPLSPTSEKPSPARQDSRPEPSVNEATESAVASGFAKDMRDQILYDHSAGCWVNWDTSAGVWRRDETNRGFAAIVRYVAEVRAFFGGTDKSMASASFCGAVERLAKADQRLAVSAAAWDTDPWLLGVPGGVVDLRTGDMRPADPALHITKQTAVAPAAPGTPAPLWSAFLASATNVDSDLMRYLQRWGGYCLTGDTREESFGFAYGRGGTGKTTFSSAVEAIMADYAAPMPADALSAKSRSNPEYALAALAGVRLAIASEVDRGAPLAEAFVKLATGGENSIPARQPYGKPFSYRPQFKLFVLANHLPSIGDRSSAMERRMKVMPFDHVPPTPDPRLKERLIAEYPAILRWMIDGCLAWQRDGLGSCAAVRQTSESYFAEQDAIGVWAGERLAFATGLQAKRADLLNDFNVWARTNGERPMYAQQFCELVRRSLGLTDKVVRGVRMFGGAELRAADDFSTADEMARMVG